GGPISGFLLGIHALGLAGWQWLFIGEGLPAVALGFVVLAYLPDGPSCAKWLSPDEREWVERRVRAERELTRKKESAGDGQAIRAVLLLAALYFLIVMPGYGVSLWMPILIKKLTSTSNLVVGLLTAVPYIASATSLVLVGMHSDARQERRMHVGFACLAGMAGILLAAHLHNPWLGIAALALAAAGTNGTMGPFWSMPTSVLSGRAAAVGIAVINSVGNLGGFAGPFLVGMLKGKTGSYTPGLWVLAGSLLAAAVLSLAIPLSGSHYRGAAAHE
ncbi:MAG TPA: MFS transporter, partial [Chthonomonadales bacterium]|nr:MFS transporter [Chthonomonadales bacterium]